MALSDDGVPSIVTAVEAGDQISVARYPIHHAPLALVSPLSSYHNDRRHDIPPSFSMYRHYRIHLNHTREEARRQLAMFDALPNQRLTKA
jgi:hypothetical protein